MSFIVYAVESADRLSLLCPPTAGSDMPEIKLVALSFIQCPKMGKRTATGEPTPDEPCAYEAMETIRLACIGKQVLFADDFMIQPLQRMSGRLTLPGGEDAALLLKLGLSTITDRPPPAMDKALHEKYVQVMNEAKAAKRGLHNPNAKSNLRQILPTTDVNATATAMKGKEEKVRIERIHSGSSFFVTIPSLKQQVQFNLTGIQCPSLNKKDGTGPDPIGAHAKYHSERFLLHRNINIRFEGIDAYLNIVGSVVGPKGTFQEELLLKGLAKVLPATVSMCDARDALRAAEKAAQDQKVGVWKDFQDRQLVVQNATATVEVAAVTKEGAAFKGPKQFEGVVVQVINSDTIVVRDLQTLEHVKVSLSGIRTSKNVQKDQDGKTPEVRVSYLDYSWEAKEFLRTKTIGKKVTVHVDSARVMEPTKEVRAMATVVESIGQVNLAAALVHAGFATVFKADQALYPDALADAEASAKFRQAGLHSPKDSPVTKVVELGRLGDAKGKYYLAFLQRGMQGNRPPVWKGVVEIVLGGGSLRIYIAKEHFVIPLRLAGVIVPNAGGFNNEPADPFAQEARDFAILQIQQMDVEVQVDTSDRAGNFIGSVTYGPTNKNFAVALVEAGLATVANADRLPYYSNLVAAEKAAKAGHKYIWSSVGAVPSKYAKLEAAKLAADPTSLKPMPDSAWEPVVLADVVDGTTVFLQRNTPEAQATKAAITAALELVASQPPHIPSKGELVGCYYREDKTWHRAKVRDVFREEGYVLVAFTDFGSQEEIKLKDVRQIPKDPEFVVVRETPSLGSPFPLAFLRPMPVDQEYCDAACEVIWAGAEGPLVSRTAYTDSTKSFVLLARKGSEGKDSVNEQLLRGGVALLNKATKLGDPACFALMERAQETARKLHKSMWKYGDVDQDEEDEHY